MDASGEVDGRRDPLEQVVARLEALAVRALERATLFVLGFVRVVRESVPADEHVQALAEGARDFHLDLRVAPSRLAVRPDRRLAPVHLAGDVQDGLALTDPRAEHLAHR